MGGSVLKHAFCPELRITLALQEYPSAVFSIKRFNANEDKGFYHRQCVCNRCGLGGAVNHVLGTCHRFPAALVLAA